MPSPRRVPAPAAVSLTVDRRPADAMPDFGDRDMAGYIPGVTGRRPRSRAAGERPRERRNDLPAQVFYVTDEIREYYAAQGRILPGRPYLGTGRDTLTGRMSQDRIDQEAST